MIETSALKIKQLQWQCRRGMLEIDLFLKRYLSTSYAQSTPQDQALFEVFLQESDQQLFFWLTGQQEVLPKYAALVHKIRDLQ